jgi:hypothetical protein
MQRYNGILTIGLSVLVACSAFGQDAGSLPPPWLNQHPPIPAIGVEPPPALPAPAAAPKAPPTLEELGKSVDAVSKNLTVTTGDGDYKLILGGAVIADVLFNQKRPVAPGTPFFLLPDSAFGFDTNTFDAHARQTNLFGLFTGPDLFHYQTGGFVLVNLYDNSIVADIYGVLPINAWGHVTSEDWRFAAGLQMDVFNPVNPTVLPFSYLGASGNTGFFRGQVRVERYLYPAEDTQITLTGAIAEPIPTTLNNQLRLSEDNGFPNFEARVACGLGPMQGEGIAARRPVEFGISGVCGQIRTVRGPQRVVGDVLGLGVDGRWAADPRWGVQGELYIGQGLGSYGTSGLQNINPITLNTIRSRGGWIEAFYYWFPDTVHTHIGYGIDDPIDGDCAVTQLLRTETYFVNTLWDMTKSIRVGVQLSYLRTAYSIPLDNDGLILHTQFMFKF